ncbi:MAG: MauE/DoxX family redox-associated membrane protein [Flavobacteriaceae bacterium]
MSCVAKLKEFYAEKHGVTEVEIEKESGKITLSTSQNLPEAKLSEGLVEKYTLRASPVFSENVEVSKWKQLYPLYLIGAYLFAFSGYRWATSSLEDAMLDFMGGFFLVFSFFKFLDLKGFAPSFSMYDPIAKKLPFYGKVYPFLEVILGALFIARFEVQILLYITLVILGSTTLGVIRSLLDKRQIQCACLGTALKLPMTEATFIENAVMLAMTFYMLF